MSEQVKFESIAESIAEPRIRGTSESRFAVSRPRIETSAEVGDVHLWDYIKVLYRRRWTAATVFLLVMSVVTVYTFTATPIYEAKTRLLIEAEDQNVVNFKQVVEEDQTKADYYQTQYNILQSRALARRTLDQLKLWDRAPFGGPADNSFSVRKAIFGAPAALVGVFKKSDDKVASNQIPGADETAAQSKAIDAFLARLTIAPVRNSRLVDVKYQLPDPVLATAIVNAFAKNYIEQNLEYKFMASKEASDWLGARLTEERKSVESAEAKLQQYREQNDAISLSDRENITVQKLADLNAALTRAKTDRIAKEAMYQQLQASQSDPSKLDTFPAILTNAFIQQQKAELADLQRQYAQMSEKLGDKHPDIIKIKSALQVSQTKINGEIAKVVQSVRSEYQAALAQENSLQAALNQQKGEALAMNRKAIDYGVLERDVESSKQIYNSLMQRAKETGVAGELKTSNVRIVDAAETPREPVTPLVRLNLSMGFAGGLLCAVGLIFFFEYLDNRIKNPDEIREYLRIPHLGLLPLVEFKGGEPLLHSSVPATFAEAIRALRTNVLFSAADEGARSLVVTSTGLGEGKSLVATNLAVSLAQTGQRVLLIDADMRRPRVHHILKRSPEPGLSNLLVGHSKASEVVLSVPGVANLWSISAGRLPPNPAELLASQRFKDLLASLRDHFQWIIIDTPPVLAVADAAIAAHVAGDVLFVLGAEMTDRLAAQTAIRQLATARVRILGAVLNRVNIQKHHYYYSQYYRPEYSKYHGVAS